MPSRKESIAIKALNREFSKSYSHEEEYEIGFYNDESTEDYYLWTFEIPGERQKHLWKYIYKTKKIQKGTVKK